MYQNIYQAVFSELSGRIAKRNAAAIYHSDVRSDYHAFKETAQYCRQRMEAVGLEQVEVIRHRVDGVTKLSETTPPRAWDAHEAWLEVLSPSGQPERIADYQRNPISLAMYSSPSGGVIDTELVDFDRVSLGQLKGKIVLSGDNSHQTIDRIIAAGAAGLVLDSVSQNYRAGKRMRQTDAVYWHNDCFVPRGVAKGFAFVICPEEGEKLRVRLRGNKPVRVRAFVDTRLYRSTIDTLTGIIPGTSRKEQEIVVVSHLYEVGANDNASGCGASLEAARTLVKLIKSGILPRPTRTIRFIMMYEIFGLLAFARANRNRLGNMLAGLNMDMVGDDENVTGSVWSVESAWPSNPSFVSDLMVSLFEQTCGWRPCRWQNRGMITSQHDGFICEPSIGIPTPFIGREEDRFYHSDHDTPGNLSADEMKRAGVIAATYLYTLADARYPQALFLGELSAQRAKSRMIARTREALSARLAGAKAEAVDRRLKHWLDVETRSLAQVCRWAGSARHKRILEKKVVEWSSDLESVIAQGRQSSDACLEALGVPQASSSQADKTPKSSPLQRWARVNIPRKNFFGVALSWTLGRREWPHFVKAGALAGVSHHELLAWTDGQRTVWDIFDALVVEHPHIKLKGVAEAYKLLRRNRYVSMRPKRD